MRRSDREVTDFREKIDIMERCDVCRLALHDEEYPYILPVNFGMKVEGEQVTLYFHGAMEGKKYELMERDFRASFEMDCGHMLVMDEENHSCTMNYESVIGCGRLEDVPEAEKTEALQILMAHYHQEDFPFGTAILPQTRVYCLRVDRMTAKRRTKRLKAGGQA